jgi:hypothetical protein
MLLPSSGFRQPYYRLSKPGGVPTINTSDPINANLVALWLPGISRFDLAGTFGLATTSGNPPVVPSPLGNAVSFNGSSQYWETKGNFIPGAGLTVSFWINPTNYNDYGPIIAQWNESATQRSWALVLGQQSSQNAVYVYSSSNGSNFFDAYYTSGVPLTGSWTHILVDLGTTAQAWGLYVNGKLASQAGTTGSYAGIFSTAQPITVGYSPQFGGAANYYDGLLDNVRIFSNPRSPAGVATRLYEEPWAGLIFPQDFVTAQLVGAFWGGWMGAPIFRVRGPAWG